MNSNNNTCEQMGQCCILVAMCTLEHHTCWRGWCATSCCLCCCHDVMARRLLNVGSAGALNHHSLLKYWKTFRFGNGTQTVNISVFSMQVTYLSSKCIFVFPTSIAGNHFCWVNKYRYRKLLYNVSLRNAATLFSNKICTTKIAQMFYVTSFLI